MDLDEILIEEIRKRPFLYDLGHKDYKNLRKKNYAWKKISVLTKLSDMECRKRWKSLRDSYKRCKKMDQAASDNNAESTRKKWRYFEAISFLDNVSNSRRTIASSNDEVEYLEESKVEGISDDDSLSEFIQCKPSYGRKEKEQKKDKDKLQKFFDLASANISETCATFVNQTERQNSTALHFSSLAAKIVEAGLPPKVVNAIEAQVSALVFEEINKFYSENAE